MNQNGPKWSTQYARPKLRDLQRHTPPARRPWPEYLGWRWMKQPPRLLRPWFECFHHPDRQHQRQNDLSAGGHPWTSGVTLKSRVKWPWFRNSWVVVHNRKIAISRDLANQNASRDCVVRHTVGKIRAWTFKICIARDRRSKHGIGKMAGSLQFFDFSDFRQKIKWP